MWRNDQFAIAHLEGMPLIGFDLPFHRFIAEYKSESFLVIIFHDAPDDLQAHPAEVSVPQHNVDVDVSI